MMMLLSRKTIRSIVSKIRANKRVSLAALLSLGAPLYGYCRDETHALISGVTYPIIDIQTSLIIAINITTFLFGFFIYKWWKLKKQLLQNDLVSQKRIWHQANFDTLTDLPNRRLFQQKLRDGINKTNRNGNVLALLLLDLDGFKQVNDSLGHAIGDLLLTKVAARIKACLYSGDTVARLGGDEFTVIIEDVRYLENVENIAKKIVAELNEPFTLSAHTVHISTSIGITIYPLDSQETDTLLKNADQAMYAAKNLGKNCYQFFTADMQKDIESKIQILQDLRSALDNHEFELHYQPIIELATGKMQKAEALIRWMHPSQGCISPLDFIPIVEESGLIIPIGDWAFNHATNFLKEIQTHHQSDFQISINVSPKQFQITNNHKENAQPFWVTKHAIKGVIIEITENLVLDLTDRVQQQLQDIREAGIETAIDDFGTGYSSLAYLKKFQIDYIKIDRSFVSNIENSESDKVLCEVIVQMAHKLGFKVVAEGIETKTQLDFLLELGCDYGQGFYLSKPLPPKAFKQYIAKESQPST